MINISVFETNYLVFEAISNLDVDFIYKLRTTRKKNFLNKIPKDITLQYNFLKKYFIKFYQNEEIYYKIYEKKGSKKVGLVRITNLQGDKKVGWESLIISESANPITGLDACLSIYSLVFDILKKDILGPWIVTKDNTRMMKIHDYMGIISIIQEDKEKYTLEVKKEDFFKKKNYFQRINLGIIILPNVC